jgi:hypothetical protein
MRQNKILLSALTVAAAATLGLYACKKGINNEVDPKLSAGILAECGPTPGSAGDTTLTGVITSDLFLSSAKEIHLSGLVYVANGATLTIQAGARVEGDPGSNGQSGGGLVITRGSKLIAEGNPECPIVFTSYRWDNQPQSGDWAGIVLLGQAPVNKSNPLIEGIPDNPPADAHYGGTDCNDNSGILQYVRIEYAGYALSPNNEINGLTLGGVGAGTKLDYVESYKSNDDAFEFFGGTVNATHLLAIAPLDDMFDTDFGFSGHIQFALGLSDQTRADFSQSNGQESDNDAAGSTTDLPRTTAQIANLTLIGQETNALAHTTNMAPSGTGLYGRAAHLRRNSAFRIANSIYMGWKWGVSLDGAATQISITDGSSCFLNNLVHAYDIPFKTENPDLGPWAFDASNHGYTDAVDPNAAILLNAPFDPSQADFALPQEGSPALGATWMGCFTEGCNGFNFTQVDYIGAFGTENWAPNLEFGGWVRYAD